MMTTEQLELTQIKRWFTENDYKINKVILGEWTSEDPRYIEYLRDRAVKRTRHDELIQLVDAQIKERLRKLTNGKPI